MCAKCPCCDAPLEILDTTDIDVEEEVYLYSVGKCPRCKKVFTYTKIFTYSGYRDLKEIGGNQK